MSLGSIQKKDNKSSKTTLKDKTAKGLFWSGLSTGTVQIISMLFGIFLARTLNIEDYGLVAMLQIFQAIAVTIIDSGFSVALVNKKEINQEDYNAVFWFTTIVSVLIYTLLFFSAPLIAEFYGKTELIPLSRVIFLSFVFAGIACVSHTVLFKHLMVKTRAWIDILSVVISGSIGLTLAFKGYGPWALAIQTVLYVSTNSVLKMIVAPWKPSLKFNFTPLKEMFSFSIKLFFTNIVIQVNKNVFTVISGKLFGEWQLGLYAQGEKWMTMGSGILTGMISSVAHPVLVHVREDRERLLGIFRKMIRFAAFVSFPVMLGVGFVAEEFITLVLGSKWLPSVPILQMLCFVGSVLPIWNLYTYIIISYGKSNLFLIGNILQGVLQISSLLITAKWGIYWMVVAFTITYFVGLFFWHYCSHRLIGYKLVSLIYDIVPYLSITLIVFSITHFTTSFMSNIYIVLAVKIILSVFLYTIILWGSNSILFKESLNFIFKKKNIL